MDETPVSLGSKAFCRDTALLAEHAPAVYGSRPMLYSVRNSTRLAAESSRARCAAPDPGTPTEPPRDFTAYFQGYPDCDPCYAASHTAPDAATRSRVISTYPVGQSLIRWYPFVETSSIEDVTCNEKESKTCRCTKCTSRNCPAKASSSSTLKSGSGRTNIMTFADIYTMTPKLTDTACGSCVVSTARSEVSGTGSDIAVRDTGRSRTKCNLAPILKYPRRRRMCDYNDLSDHCDEFGRSAAEHAYDDEPSRASSRYSLSGHRKEEPRGPGRTEMLYNEGISDRLRHLCPLRTAAGCLQDEERCGAPGGGNRWRLRYEEEYHTIPHSHRYPSRYHRHCKHSRSKMYVQENEACRPVPSRARLPARRSPPPVDYHCPPCIRLPRKVLTSEADIDQFAGAHCPLGRYPGYHTCARRNIGLN